MFDSFLTVYKHFAYFFCLKNIFFFLIVKINFRVYKGLEIHILLIAKLGEEPGYSSVSPNYLRASKYNGNTTSALRSTINIKAYSNWYSILMRRRLTSVIVQNRCRNMKWPSTEYMWNFWWNNWFIDVNVCVCMCT